MLMTRKIMNSVSSKLCVKKTSNLTTTKTGEAKNDMLPFEKKTRWLNHMTQSLTIITRKKRQKRVLSEDKTQPCCHKNRYDVDYRSIIYAPAAHISSRNSYHSINFPRSIHQAAVKTHPRWPYFARRPTPWHHVKIFPLQSGPAASSSKCYALTKSGYRNRRRFTSFVPDLCHPEAFQDMTQWYRPLFHFLLSTIYS